VKRINESDSSRFIRVLFINKDFQPISEFNRRIDGLVSGEEWVMPEADAELLRPHEDSKTHISSRSHVSANADADA
jgi:hypothetical protein